MKLLVISHACVTPVNQSFYADLEEETGWVVTLVIPSRWKTEYGMRDGSGRWATLNATIHALKVLFPGDIPRHLYRNWFISLLRDEKPDAIYVHHEPYGFATAQIYLANLVTGQRPIGFYAAQNILKRYPSPIRQVERWVLKNSHFSFPVTKGALEILRAKGYTNVAEVLPLAINTDLYRPMSEWSVERRRELGISPDSFLLGYLGRFVEEKGLGTLLDALDRLPDLDWELLLIGNGPYETELRQQISLMGPKGARIHIRGYVSHDEAPGWLSMIDTLVLPSETRPGWKEQFGRVLVEAMACGTPVVGSDSGEIPNVIETTGGGLIFPEGDVAALSKCIDRLGRSTDLRSKLIVQGQKAIEDMYEQRRLVGRFASSIEGAVNRSRLKKGIPVEEQVRRRGIVES
jgi:glycosyltransferase involved in cell wall biosynthesis